MLDVALNGRYCKNIYGISFMFEIGKSVIYDGSRNREILN